MLSKRKQITLCFIFMLTLTGASKETKECQGVMVDMSNMSLNENPEDLHNYGDEIEAIDPRKSKQVNRILLNQTDVDMQSDDGIKYSHSNLPNSVTLEDLDQTDVDMQSDDRINYSNSNLPHCEEDLCPRAEMNRRKKNESVTNLGEEFGLINYNDVGIRIVVEKILELNDDTQTARLHFTVEMAYFNDNLIIHTKALLGLRESEFPHTYDANFNLTYEAVPKLAFSNSRDTVGEGDITDVQMTLLESDGESPVKGFFTAKRTFLVEIQDSIQSRNIPFDFQDWNIKLSVDKEVYRYDRRYLQFFKFEHENGAFFPSTFHHSLLKHKKSFQQKICQALGGLFCIFTSKHPKKVSNLFMENQIRYKEKAFYNNGESISHKKYTEKAVYKKAFQSKHLKIKSESSRDEWYVYGYVQNGRQAVIKQGVENDQVVFRFWTERKLAGAVLDVFMLFGVAFVSSAAFLLPLFPATNAAVAATVMFPTFIAILLMTVYKDNFPSSQMQWLRLQIIFAQIFDVVALAVSRSPIFGCIDVETKGYFSHDGSSFLEQSRNCVTGEGSFSTAPFGCYICLSRDRQPRALAISLAIKFIIGFAFFVKILNKDKSYIDTDVYLYANKNKFRKKNE